MGIWTNLSGEIKVKRSEHFSPKKYFGELLDGQDYTFRVVDHTFSSEKDFINFEIAVNLDKIEFDKYLKQISSDFDKKDIRYDLNISTRLLG